MDRTDWHILDESAVRCPAVDRRVGRRVSLSAPSTGDRVRRLQDSGVVTGYHAHVDPAAVGRSVRAFVRMQCYGPTCVLRDPAVAAWPEVLTMHRVTGVDCTVMLVAVDDIAAFQALLDRLADYGRPRAAWSSRTSWPGLPSVRCRPGREDGPRPGGMTMSERSDRVTLRFLAAPTDLGYSGTVDAGRVLEWIDKAGYALAVGGAAGTASRRTSGTCTSRARCSSASWSRRPRG